jgi:serine phosphatase RsbU (regulator of sigma subunit)
VDAQLVDTPMTPLATCFYATLTLAAAGGGPGRPPAELDYATAGHPPPVLRYPDGAAQLLDGPRGTLLGLQGVGPDRPPRASARIEVPAGSTLVCYTDGLLDAFGADADEALEKLRLTVASHPPSSPAAALVEDLMGANTGGGSGRADDVAVLAVTLE